MIIRFINEGHYRSKQLDDKLSSSILDRYIESLDPTRAIFHAQDIKQLDHYRYTLDDALRAVDLQPAFDIYNLFRRRLNDRVQFALTVVHSPFNFTVDEDYQFDRSDAAWAPDKTALDVLWRKRVKNDYLSLKLAGKKEAEIVEVLRKRFERLERSNAQSSAEDVYQAFINAYTLSIEPHTGYLSPQSSEDFKIQMSLSLEGIGAALGLDNEYTVIRRVIPGGPAEMSGKLQKEDRIIGVGQGRTGKITDVVGWRLDDVVREIRGAKGTIVRVQILPKGVGIEGPSKTVELIRNQIKLQDQAAKKRIIEVGKEPHKRRIGVVTVPTFYHDFDAQSSGDLDYRSTTRDVALILQSLKKSRVDGIVVDLRGNGGGSLKEATTLTGLFIRSGPIVQVRDFRGQIDLSRDDDPNSAYDGPMAVLVDKGSASASEIFAGAIQDYKRGLIIGQTTFGKGTVQQLIDLNRYRPLLSFGRANEDEGSRSPPKMGQLKLTFAQFFRVNGESTQHRGVVPDITMPAMYSHDDQGESSLKNALPWARIAPAPFLAGDISSSALSQARMKHEERIAKDLGFKYFRQLSEYYRKIKDQKVVSLMEDKRKKERDLRESERTTSENQLRQLLGLKALTRKEVVNQDEEEEDASFKILLTEAAYVLSDYIEVAHAPAIVKSGAKVAP